MEEWSQRGAQPVQIFQKEDNYPRLDLFPRLFVYKELQHIDQPTPMLYQGLLRSGTELKTLYSKHPLFPNLRTFIAYFEHLPLDTV